MNERLVIKNFGPIKHVDLEIKKVNVLIGDQGTGKSTVAKALAICRHFSYISINNQSSFENGLINWDLIDYVSKDSDTLIEYHCDDYDFIVTFEKNKIKNNSGLEIIINKENIQLTPKSRSFQKLTDSLKDFKQTNKEISLSDISPSFFQENVKEVMDNPVYIDTDRGLQSIFSLGKNSIQNISDSKFNQFAKLDQINRAFQSEVNIEPVKIKYKYINGQGYFKLDSSEEYYTMKTAASGFQKKMA